MESLLSRSGDMVRVTALTMVFLCPAAQALGQDVTCEVRIHQETLGEALAALSRQCGVRLLYPYELARTRGIHPVKGRRTVSEALTIMLRDTSLTGALTSRGVITISRQEPAGESRMVRGRTKLLGGVSALVAGLLGAGAQAQQAPPTAAGAEEGVTVGDIVVTARRREERLRDVPVAATVFSGEALRNRGDLGEPLDVLRSVPGLKVSDTSAPSTQEVTLRGSGASKGTGGDAAVGLYRDDAYIAGGGFGSRTFSRLDLLDVEQIQVLRGPQGALYGRNSVGGAVNLISAKPGWTRSGYLNLNYQFETNLKQVQLVVNQPLTDEVAVRFSGEWFDQPDGSFFNSAENRYADRTKGYAVRGQIRYRHENLDASLLYENAFYYLPPVHSTLTIQPGTPGYPPQGFIQDPFVVHTNGNAPFQQGFENVAARVTYDFEFATLKAVSSYRLRKSHNYNDNDSWDPASLAAAKAMGVALLVNDANVSAENLEKWKGYYNSIYLTGKKVSGLTWLAGAEYFFYRTPYSVRVLRRTPTKANPSIGSYLTTDPSYDSWAVFGSVGYDVTPKLNAQVDVRYSHDKRNADASTRDIITQVVDPVTLLVGASEKYSKVSYSASLSYHLTPEWLTYARLATAYRAGNFNSTNSDPRAPNPAPASYGPESGTSYEVGAKGNITRHIFATVAAYRTDVKDVQSQTGDGCALGNPVCPVTGQNYLVNAGTSRVWGVEVETSGSFEVAGGHLLTSVGISRQGGEFRKGPLSGLTFPQNPKWIGIVEVDYRHPFVMNSTAFVNLNYSSQSGGTVDTDMNLPIDDNQLLDARIGVQFGSVEIAGYMKNVTDERYSVFYTPQARRINTPRLYGIQGRYRW